MIFMKTNAETKPNDLYGELKLLMDAQLNCGSLDELSFLRTLKICAEKNQTYIDSVKLDEYSSKNNSNNSRVISKVCTYLCNHDSSLLQSSEWSTPKRKRFEFIKKETKKTINDIDKLQNQIPEYFNQIYATKLDELRNCFSNETSTQIDPAINVFIEYILDAYKVVNNKDTSYTGSFTIPVKFEEITNKLNYIDEEHIYSALKSLSKQTNIIPPFINPKSAITKKQRYRLGQKQSLLLTGLLDYVNNRQINPITAE
ncbi:hypothetical protein GQ473_05535 [archaeon]|nr:hypothetical protein [archaeon]